MNEKVSTMSSLELIKFILDDISNNGDEVKGYYLAIYYGLSLIW